MLTTDSRIWVNRNLLVVWFGCPGGVVGGGVVGGGVLCVWVCGGAGGSCNLSVFLSLIFLVSFKAINWEYYLGNSRHIA